MSRDTSRDTRQTHHFAVYSQDLLTPLRDADGKVLIFLSRERAWQEAAARGLKDRVLKGMGDAQWKKFREAEPYVVVED